MERMREEVTELPSRERLEQMRRAGWRVAAVEWRREAHSEDALAEEVPYGLRLEPEGSRLVEEPGERRALVAMLELIVADMRISKVADEMNRLGFRTRNGTPWTPAAVFDLMPRLVEVGPGVFASDAWAARKSRRSVH